MNLLQRNVLLLFLAISMLSACSKSIAPAAPQAPKSLGFEFDATQRPGGTAFYSLNGATGQLSYMLDFGERAGQWSNYGNQIRETAGNPLLLAVEETAANAAFYAMDGGTGQVYYMLDSGAKAGQWVKFGGMIRQNALNLLQFEASFRNNATTFYAYDTFTHQTYYMNDVGERAGKWNKFGTPVASK